MAAASRARFRDAASPMDPREEKAFGEKLEGALRRLQGPPPDAAYFDRIWEEIAFKAPVREKWKWRPLFSITFILLFLVVFYIGFNDFLSSASLLRRVRESNLRSRHVNSSLAILPGGGPEAPEGREYALPDGSRLFTLQASRFQVFPAAPEGLSLEFISGHIRVAHALDHRRALRVRTSDVAAVQREGECELFAYDGMLRITSGSPELEIAAGEASCILKRGDIFYMLNGQAVRPR